MQQYKINREAKEAILEKYGLGKCKLANMFRADLTVNEADENHHMAKKPNVYPPSAILI